MSGEDPELDELQAAYKNAVEAWIASIRKEEALASVNHSVAEVDEWEKAHFDEDEMRTTVKAAKRHTKTPCARNSSDSRAGTRSHWWRSLSVAARAAKNGRSPGSPSLAFARPARGPQAGPLPVCGRGSLYRSTLYSRLKNRKYRLPEIIIAAGRVSTQASAMLRIVDHCSPDPLAAMVPAMPDDSTWVVETGSP